MVNDISPASTEWGIILIPVVSWQSPIAEHVREMNDGWAERQSSSLIKKSYTMKTTTHEEEGEW